MKELGQLLMTGFQGTKLSEEHKDFLQNENIGGVVLFSENYESSAQLAEMINELQTLRDEYPLFVAVDHEGGRVQRFKEGFTYFPAMGKVARIGSPKLIFEIHRIMAEELSACGVNLNFAPVADTLTSAQNDVIGDRSFGEQGEEVAKFITAAIRGLQTYGVMACAKHFPGHGGTNQDSHDELPVLKRSLEELQKEDFIPFQRASKSRVAMMMLAHLQVDALDAEFMTTFSPKAYEALRKGIRFNRIIITDDLEMGAVTQKSSPSEAAVHALKAGADIALFRNFKTCQEALEALKKAVKVRDIQQDDVLAKFQRVMQGKKQFLGKYEPIFIPDIGRKLEDKANQSFAQEIWQKVESLES